MHFIPQIGSEDGLLVTDTTAVTGINACAIQMVEDTVFTSLTSGTMSVQGAIGDAAFKAGTVIFGNFTAFELASGAIIAYDAK